MRHIIIFSVCVVPFSRLTSNHHPPCTYSRIAKNAMSLSERFNLSDQMPELRLNFYTAVGRYEWLHSGAQALRGGFESALSSGNANMGFFCAVQATSFSIMSGEKKLTSLLKEIDYYLHLLETYKSEVAKKYLLAFRETVSKLIDKGEETSIEAKECLGDVSDSGNKFIGTFYFHQAFRHFWLGYNERCCHFAQKCFGRIPQGKYLVCLIKFYYGLNLIDTLKKKMNAAKQKEVDEIVTFMKVVVTHAGSNGRNKLELLEAEQYALAARHSEAVASYDAAIASAKKSKFTHEQGLACEKAGFYFKMIGRAQNALLYFQQAHACYEEWGSTVKVEVIQRELDELNSIVTNNT